MNGSNLQMEVDVGLVLGGHSRVDGCVSRNGLGQRGELLLVRGQSMGAV